MGRSHRTAAPAAGPAPFRSLRPASVSPVLLTCEHATKRLPAPLRPTAAERRVLASHWGWDIGAWELTREVARRLGTGAVGGRWSRLYIDLNRPVDDPTLIRREVEGLTLSWNGRISPGEVERRMVAWHAPYHVEVDRQILRRIVRGVRPLLLAIHTFTDDLQGQRRTFDFGVLYDDHRALAHRLGRSLRAQGCSVRYNEPYSGLAGMMYSVDRHGSHHRLPCLELEVNQARFDEAGAALRFGAVVARAVEDLLRSLRGAAAR